ITFAESEAFARTCSTVGLVTMGLPLAALRTSYYYITAAVVGAHRGAPHEQVAFGAMLFNGLKRANRSVADGGIDRNFNVCVAQLRVGGAHTCLAPRQPWGDRCNKTSSRQFTETELPVSV